MHRYCSRVLGVAMLVAALCCGPSVFGASSARASGVRATNAAHIRTDGKKDAKAAGGDISQAAMDAAGQRARELLDTVITAGSNSARLAAVDELAGLGAAAVPALTELLARPRRSTEDERREVLREIRADIPDEKGRFASRRRRSKEEVITRDDYDWLAALAELPPQMPGLGEVMADVALIRALAASKQIEAADPILDFAFDDIGILYRDECGRYLRNMAPYSFPTLIANSGSKRQHAAQRRYAGYQLDRMDRSLPQKALDHASVDENLKIAVLEAYGQTKLREAVAAVLAVTNDPASRVRQAARTAWMAYVTGPEPPPAPKRRLQLPGGKLTDEEEPLWLTYRELADVELRRVYEETIGDRPSRRASLKELSELLFAHYDALRAERLAAEYRQAAAVAEAGKWAEAVQAYDRILAQRPEHPERASMARAYLEHGKALEQQEKWSEAAAAYSKAQGLAPQAENADQVLAAHYHALGRALAAEGKDGSTAFRRAASLDATRDWSDSTGGVDASGRPLPASPGRWMLYAGLGGGAGAVILLILGLALRRR